MHINWHASYCKAVLDAMDCKREVWLLSSHMPLVLVPFPWQVKDVTVVDKKAS